MVHLSTYQYDPFGRRVHRVVTPGADSATPAVNTTYIYDGANIIEELDSSGNVLAKYTQGAGVDEPLAMLRNGSTYYYHADGLGSITSLTDSTGAVATTYSYASFGSAAGSSGSLMNGPATNGPQTDSPVPPPNPNPIPFFINPYQFTGRELDPESGLYYYRARYYDPSVGRFLSEDPIRSAAGVNFYDYTINNPLLWTDPEGFDITVYFLNGLRGNPSGHILVSVNGSTAVGFDTAGGIWDVLAAIGETVPGAVKSPDMSKRTVWDKVTVHTTPTQDQAMLNFIAARTEHPGAYNVGSRSCTQFGRDVLKAGGIDLPYSIRPKGLLQDLNSYEKQHPNP